VRTSGKLALPALTVLALFAANPSFGADPAIAASSATAETAQSGIVVIGGAGPQALLTAGELGQLPVTQIIASFEGEHGHVQAKFEGPLLWSVLDHASAIDPAKMRDQVRQTVLITGRDGYKAVLALGEISPAFEGKQVIVAERMDGQPIAPEHFRLVVPGDRRGGRSVRDVATIAIITQDVASH
jgi:Oxidoreductase molybdopterin binding domain